MLEAKFCPTCNVPDYRGYAHLGIGAYLINHSNAEDAPEIIISMASEEEKLNRVVGDERENPADKIIQPEEMAIRIRFENVAGLDVLEKQLRYLREVHFPETLGKENT